MTPIEIATRRWVRDAACKTSPLFVAADHESKSARHAREARAKQVCAGCRVRRECLEYALRVREPFGIWGGLDEIERLGLSGE